MNLDVSVVAVISLGCIAISGILFPLLLKAYTDYQNNLRMIESAKFDRINKSTIELLD